MALLRMKEYAKASKDFDIVLKTQPHNVLIRWAYAEALRGQAEDLKGTWGKTRASRKESVYLKAAKEIYQDAIDAFGAGVRRTVLGSVQATVALRTSTGEFFSG